MMYFVLAAVLLSAFSVFQAQAWESVAYILASQGCPFGLQPVTAVDSGCSSVFFSTFGVYSEVCGWVYGYNKGTTDGFYRWGCPGCTIDGPYVDGVSITHGQPRQHIWSFAATSKIPALPYHEHYCPCTSSPNQYTYLPPFVGNDYSCEYESANTYTTADQLWGGQGCVASHQQCYDRGSWFCKEIPKPTTDAIEFRLCTDQGRGDKEMYIEEIELSVQ